MILFCELLVDVDLIIFQIQIVEQIDSVSLGDTCTEVVSDHKREMGRSTFREAVKDPLELFLWKDIFFMLF